VDSFDFAFQLSLSKRRLRELADLSWRSVPAPTLCFSARREPETLDQLTTSIELIMSALQETVTASTTSDCHREFFGKEARFSL
jgi:hypothetical protein